MPKGKIQKKKTKGGKKKSNPQQQFKKVQKKKEKVSNTPGRKRKSTKKSAASVNAARINKRRQNLIIRSKFQNPRKGTAPTSLETKICEYLVDLEASSKDLKEHLRDLGIVSAREIITNRNTGKRAIVIFVPLFQHKRWQKLQERVQTELEKKFSGKDVLFVANRKQIKNNVPRPRTHTITAVHKALLDDVVYPTKIVGKRTRFRVGGSRVLKVYLEPNHSKGIEARIPTYEAVYRKLTKKNVIFLFPRYVI